MNDFFTTKHAQIRKQQRGFRNMDISMILNIATPIGSDAYVVTNNDAMREITKRKHEIQQLERLRGSKIIVENNTIITCYHACKKELKKTMRRKKSFQ